VFAGMASGRMTVLQQLGLGLAVAVMLDAFVVRTVIAPAMIALIGERFWWLPRWLEWLPRIGVEGPAPEKDAAGATPGRAE
jgi:RND superfamily putative drug exporter